MDKPEATTKSDFRPVRPIRSRFWIGEIAYLVVAEKKLKGMITAIIIEPNGIMYRVVWGDDSVTVHYEIELSHEYQKEYSEESRAMRRVTVGNLFSLDMAHVVWWNYNRDENWLDFQVAGTRQVVRLEGPNVRACSEQFSKTSDAMIREIVEKRIAETAQSQGESS